MRLSRFIRHALSIPSLHASQTHGCGCHQQQQQILLWHLWFRLLVLIHLFGGKETSWRIGHVLLAHCSQECIPDRISTQMDHPYQAFRGDDDQCCHGNYYGKLHGDGWDVGRGGE